MKVGSAWVKIHKKAEDKKTEDFVFIIKYDKNIKSKFLTSHVLVLFGSNKRNLSKVNNHNS